jgi:DNA-binding NtrC family response regulator
VSTPEPSARPLKVLIVDDDPAFLASVAAVFSEEFEVSCASSGEQALALLELGEFQVVCADYKMPGMTGADLLGHVSQRFVGVSGLLVTGADQEIKTRQWREEYVLGVIAKPFDPQRLINTVRRFGELAALRQSIARAARTVGGK